MAARLGIDDDELEVTADVDAALRGSMDAAGLVLLSDSRAALGRDTAAVADPDDREDAPLVDTLLVEGSTDPAWFDGETGGPALPLGFIVIFGLIGWY